MSNELTLSRTSALHSRQWLPIQITQKPPRALSTETVDENAEKTRRVRHPFTVTKIAKIAQ